MAAISAAISMKKPADAALEPLGATNTATGTGLFSIAEIICSMEDPNPPGVCSRIRMSWARSACARAMLLTIYSAVIGSIVPLTSMRAMSARHGGADARKNQAIRMEDRIMEAIGILVRYSQTMITQIDPNGSTVKP